LINEIHYVSQLLGKIVEQTEEVNQGGKPKDRIISLDNPDVRPIAKGKRG